MYVQDIGKGITGISIDRKSEIHLSEKGRWKGIYSLRKWDFTHADGSIDVATQQSFELDSKNGMSFDALKDKYGVFLKSDEEIGENLLLNTGINNMLNSLIGTATTSYTNANAQLGVGDSTTAAAATQTGLQAGTNFLWVGMDATYPTAGASQQVIFRTTFTSAQANYAWQEFCVRNSSGSAISLNRLVSVQGTKTVGQSWQLTLTVTIS